MSIRRLSFATALFLVTTLIACGGGAGGLPPAPSTSLSSSPTATPSPLTSPDVIYAFTNGYGFSGNLVYANGLLYGLADGGGNTIFFSLTTTGQKSDIAALPDEACTPEVGLLFYDNTFYCAGESVIALTPQG